MENKDEKFIQLPKLATTTYRDWLDVLEDVLASLKLSSFIKPSFFLGKSPEDFSDDILASMAKVKTIIKTSITIEDRQLVRSCTNPVEILKELNLKYRGPSAKSAWELLVDWDDVTYDGSISGLFNKLREMFVQFEEKGLVLPRYFINAKVRKCLPAQYDDCRRLLMIYNIGRKESDYMTDKQFETEILKIERELKSKNDSSQSASLVSVSKKKQVKFYGKCNFCGVEGHKESDCRQKRKFLQRSKSGNKVEPKQSRSNSNTDQADLVITSALVKTDKPSNNGLPIKFIADCGASFHVVNDKSLLTNVRKTTGNIKTVCGTVTNPDQGDMICDFYNGARWISCKINDVYFVPNQPFNLISMGRLCQNGFRNEMNQNSMVVYRNNDPILVGNWSSEYVNIMELQIRVKTSVINTAVVRSLSCWHERLGHFSADKIAKMIRQKRVDGVPLSLEDDMQFCSSCQIGKATDVSHTEEEDNKNIKVGMKLHIDIGGYFMSNPSIHGNRFFLLCIDHRSRYMKLGFMKSRDQTLDLFKRIINEIKMDTGSDNFYRPVE
ncbi:hypothetical protein BLA29_004077 [Euroglyphus maynei]|uniref:CCHC-type domain-containing protein n=1 Tax=Euroglyphus maynei TaxID=6958 RepID=A0A1Y3BRK5_EURMA|nr:hypothetical protein BLA29_004077 [Euroglyphus maynei]